MSGIICAVRGGPVSQSTIKASIQLAKEIQEQIHFVYVVNLEFLRQSSSGRSKLVSKEMAQMGEMIVLSASIKAESHGVAATGVVTRGQVTEEIISLAREIDASHIILGASQGADDDVFNDRRRAAFTESIAAETGAEIIFAQDDSA